MEHGSKFLNFVASDSLDKSLNAILTLFEAGKHNLVYYLCECLQQQETSGSTRLPLDQMPYGLLHYNIRFLLVPKKDRLIVLHTMLHGLRPCLHILVINGSVYTGDQYGNM